MIANENANLLLTKGAAVLGSAVLSVLFAMLPWKILSIITRAYYGQDGKSTMSERYQNRLSLVLCALTCFTGGVFLGTCMLTMFPELQVHFRCVKRLAEQRQGVNERLLNYPWPEFAISIGFFFVFFVEEVTMFVLNRWRSSTGRGAASRCQSHSTPSDKRPSASGQDGEEMTAMLRQKSEMSKRIRSQSECGDLVEPPVRPHPHNHVVRSIVLLSTLSFHTVIESMSYALHTTPYGVWTLFWTSNIHQAVVAFALGTQLARTHRRNVVFVIVCVCAYSLSTPIGFLSGLAFVQVEQQLLTEETIVMVLEGLSVGAFLYVTFYEVLSHELNNEHSSFLKLLCIFVGCAAIGGLSGFTRKNERFGEEVH